MSYQCRQKTVRLFIVVFIHLSTVNACAGYEGAQPTASLYFTPYSSLTPIPPVLTNSLTVTPEPDIPPGCTIVNENGKLYVLSDNVIFALGPDKEVLDQALADNFPEWANFEQTFSSGGTPVVESAGTILRAASFQERFALNSAVNLVTVGVSLDWQIPADGDLYSKALVTGERLVGLWHDWNLNENNIQASYPEISNASTYALYIFFDQDKEKLQNWCDTYQKLFRSSP